jgi:ABC-type amino acid transport substrate-binding protein
VATVDGKQLKKASEWVLEAPGALGESPHGGSDVEPFMEYRMRTIFRIAILLVSLAPVTWTNALADTLEKVALNKTIHLGYRTNSIPFSYLDKTEVPIGYAVDICKVFVAAIAKELKAQVQVTWVPVGPNERSTALSDGLVDVDCADSTVTNQSQQTNAFTIPIFVAATRILVQGSNSFDLTRSSDKTIVTTSQSGNEAMLRYVLGQTGSANKMLVVRTPKAALEALRRGTAQALFADDATLFGIRIAQEDANVQVLSKAYSMRPKAIAFRKDDARLRHLLHREMRNLIAGGEIARMHESWFNSILPGSKVNLQFPVSYLLRETWKTPSDQFVDHAFGHMPD